MDQQPNQLGRVVLKSGGTVKASDAKRFAEDQYAKFDQHGKVLRHREADEQIAELARQARNLPRLRTHKNSFAFKRFLIQGSRREPSDGHARFLADGRAVRAA